VPSDLPVAVRTIFDVAAETVTEADLWFVAPRLSVTRSVTAYVPAAP
jgi:hypothetical protein